MKVLGVEASTYEGSIAVADENSILGEFYIKPGPSHAEKLLPSIERFLGELSIEKNELSGIAVTLGPGSFTSLRIGIATAKGLALSLGIPIVGVSSLELLATNVPYAPFNLCPMIDARRGEIFTAFFRAEDGNVLRISEDSIHSPRDLINSINEKTIFIGDGALLYRDFLEDSLGGAALFCPVNLNYSRASGVAILGLNKLNQGLEDDLQTLAPEYLRMSEAEISLKRREMQ